MSIPKPDSTWLPKVKKFHRQIYETWNFEPEDAETFQGVCLRLNRYYECEKRLTIDGLTFVTETGQVRAHPLLAEQKNSWAGYVAGMRLLNLHEPKEKKPAHRPTKGTG